MVGPFGLPALKTDSSKTTPFSAYLLYQTGFPVFEVLRL
jgi:hypothetical protein